MSVDVGDLSGRIDVATPCGATLAGHVALPAMTVDWEQVERTRHRMTRKGAEMTVRVLDVPGDGGGKAIIVGDAERSSNPLVRIHSRCLYGDALQSDDCDCGPELSKSMDAIQREGAGVLFYLEQEGRGAGLEVKAMGLRLTQSLGITTFEAYHELGYPDDLRRFDHVAQSLLDDLELRSIRLLTNNPDKQSALAEHRIEVDRVPLRTVPRSVRSRKYLEEKRVHRGHALPPRWAWVCGIWAKRVGVAVTTLSVVGAWALDIRELVITSHLLMIATFILNHPANANARFRVRAMLRHLGMLRR
ncbi:GTP cyclohydrolase II [Nocardia sp. NPDC056100]|uniref:GTP cyclohydrolase II n=1 Tax=Nocardia sp. NPDC056100 TaxID=3345712 RepID=UPI0035DFA417